MGEIISSEVLVNDNIVYKIVLEKEEVLALKNALKNINLFAADLCDKEAKIIERGYKGVTKYFHVPFCLRFRKKKAYEKIFYQKLETESKVFYIYVIPKNNATNF